MMMITGIIEILKPWTAMTIIIWTIRNGLRHHSLRYIVVRFHSILSVKFMIRRAKSSSVRWTQKGDLRPPAMDLDEFYWWI
jgi:hypothetical protein